MEVDTNKNSECKFSDEKLTHPQHRAPSLERFFPADRAYKCYLSDIDSVLYIEWTSGKKPLCLFEVARDVGQPIESKNADVLVALSKNSLHEYPVFVVLYKVAQKDIPNYEITVKDIESFKIMQVAPKRELIGIKTPQEFADFVWKMREFYRRKFYLLD